MKEKKIIKVENEAAQKNPKRNYIEYYINPEKKVITAVLTGVRQEMTSMFEKKFNKYGLSARGDLWKGSDALYEAMKTIPDKITASATCAPEDEFDTDAGCNIARMRLLQKLYYYREKVGRFLLCNLESAESELYEYINFCNEKFYDFDVKIEDVIYEYEN